MSNLPSVKTLEQLTGRYCQIEPKEGAKLLRKVLECTNREQINDIVNAQPEVFGSFTVNSSDIRYHPLQYLKLSVADYLTHGHGVEFIPKGHNAKSPSIEYVNHGDTYNVTLIWTGGRYKVGCWGDIVEKGNYD